MTTTISSVSVTSNPDACAEATILPVVAALFPENPQWRIVSVKVKECKNGYARVSAIPDQVGCPSSATHCRETEQVFLKQDTGSWMYLASGTGLQCPEPPISDACVALGLS